MAPSYNWTRHTQNGTGHLAITHLTKENSLIKFWAKYLNKLFSWILVVDKDKMWYHLSSGKCKSVWLCDTTMCLVKYQSSLLSSESITWADSRGEELKWLDNGGVFWKVWNQSDSFLSIKHSCHVITLFYLFAWYQREFRHMATQKLPTLGIGSIIIH